MPQIPLMILNDAPDRIGGLSRIGRELASLICTWPEFRVAYLGRGGMGSSLHPWVQYSYPESAQWGEQHIERAWTDFAQKQYGIILSMWDASRMLWFASTAPTADPSLSRFLGPDRTFEKWGYFPVDGMFNHRYGTELSSVVNSYNRVLAASEWGLHVLEQSRATDGSCQWHTAPDWMPHGIQSCVFTNRETTAVPHGPTRYRIGCVMANQERKHWGIAFETFAILSRQYGNNISFWAHVDEPVRYWNLYALAADFNVPNVHITTSLSDSELAFRYSDCNVTILPTGGEGFGYPIAESMLCGTPCITTNYAAGQELVDPQHRVTPVAHKLETRYNLYRAVNSADKFAAGVVYAIANQETHGRLNDSNHCHNRCSHLYWHNLDTQWRKWFMKGIENNPRFGAY